MRITVQLVKVADRLAPVVGDLRPDARRHLRGAGRHRAVGGEGAAPHAAAAKRRRRSADAKVKAEVAAAAKGRSENAEAYQLYLQARILREQLTRDGAAKAIQCLPAGDRARSGIRARMGGTVARLRGPGRAALGSFRRGVRAGEGGGAARDRRSSRISPKRTRPWAGCCAPSTGTGRAPRRRSSARSSSPPAARSSMNARRQPARHARPARQGDRASAQGDAARSAERAAPPQPALYCLGAGELQEAEAVLHKVLQMSPQGGLTCCWLGVLALAQDRPGGARSS